MRPSLTQLGIMGVALVLVGTAVIIARGDVAQEIAVDARELRMAESVLTAAGSLVTVVDMGVLAALGPDESPFVDQGIGEPSDIRRAIATLEAAVEGLQAFDGTAGLEMSTEVVTTGALAVVQSLELGEVARAESFATEVVAPGAEVVAGIAARVADDRSRQIEALADSVGTVTTAARYLSALLIPAITLLVMFRAMRRAQRVTLLKNDLARERELRHKKDLFLAAASHHIRTPLTAVVGFAELLRDRTRDFNAGVRHQVTELLAMQAEETAMVVDDLLVAARHDLGDLELLEEEIDVRDIVDDATSDWESTQRMRLTIRGNAVTVADPKWLTHALRNLLRNATSFGGQSIEVGISEVLRRVVIEVSDDGEPLQSDADDKMFNQYYSYQQVEGLAPSLGLGLSVARRVARAMGGDVRYHRLDGRNVFELTVPRADGRQPAKTGPRTVDPSVGRPTRESIMAVVEAGGPNMVYQPIVNMVEGRQRVVGYEALARFETEGPEDWFESASSLGIGLDLEIACIQAAIDGFDTPDDAFLAVNLSDRTLQSSRLLAILDEINPSRLVLELSEAATIKSYEQTRTIVEALSERGVRLAVDDVGAGEIDLWHISRIGAHVVKIDLSLTSRIVTHRRDRALVKAIVAMAKEVGLTVIAEGVERPDQHRMLLDLGVELGQGYLYGRPMPLSRTGGSPDGYESIAS